MLASFVVQLRPRKSGSLPPSTGPAMHATFLNWVRKFDPALSASLHDQEGLKPYTVSPLQLQTVNPVMGTPSQELRLSPDQLYWFRITSMEEGLSKTLLEKLCGNKKPEFPAVLERDFIVEKVTADPTEHPWAATGSFEELIALALSENKQRGNSDRVRLLFYSPTTFKSSGRLLPIPLPVQTFSSLAIRWNSYCSIQLNAEFFTFLEKDVSISGYELKTEMVLKDGSYRGIKVLGFRGWCEYIAYAEEPEWVQMLQALGQFAFFAGVGYKTTQGFGQTIMLGNRPS